MPLAGYRWIQPLIATALALSGCASAVAPVRDASPSPDAASDSRPPADAPEHTNTCDGGIQWLDPVTDPPLPIAVSPVPVLTALSDGRFAVFHWAATAGAIARFVPTAGPWSRDATVAAPWAGRPSPGDIVVQRLFVGENRTGPMFGMVGNGGPGIFWAQGPAPDGTWPAPTALDPSLREIGDLAFFDDRVVVSVWSGTIGMGTVSGVAVANVDRSTGAIVDRQVWDEGAAGTGFYTLTDGPRLARDGDQPRALRPGLQGSAAATGALTVFDGPGAGVSIGTRLAIGGGGAYRSTVGPNHRLWVMEARDVHPRLELGFVEAGVATPMAWTSDRVPEGFGDEFDVAPAGDGAALAYLEHGDLVVTIVDRDGAVRTTGTLPLRLPDGLIAEVRLAAANDGTFALLWTSVDVPQAFDDGAAGIVRFRACGE